MQNRLVGGYIGAGGAAQGDLVVLKPQYPLVQPAGSVACALSGAGIGPVADEAMSARHRPATANGRTVALPYLSILIVLIVAVSGAIPALTAEGGSRAASQA